MLLYYQDYVDSDIMSIIRFSSLFNMFSLLGFTFAHVSINLEKDEIKFLKRLIFVSKNNRVIWFLASFSLSIIYTRNTGQGYTIVMTPVQYNSAEFHYT